MKTAPSIVILLLVCSLGVAQVLFPGNSPERRSRTYDVIHYKIVVDFDEKAKRVDGTTSITFSPLVSNLDSAVFDAAEMDIHSVSLSSGRAVRFNNRSPELSLLFSPALHLNDTVTASIQYSCTPQAGLYFIAPDSTAPNRHRQIWSQGEDTDNHFWFPCYDYPNDKATSEVIATVPDSFVLLSNGKLLSTSHDSQRKTRTFHWFESKPHASYLIMIAAGEYDVVSERYRDISLEYYVYKDKVQDGVQSLAKTSVAMKFFEDRIGVRYPWEKYAQIWISKFMWGGMENVSAVTLNDESYLLDPRARIDFTSDDVVAHELAHQWWGDLITSRDWNNLWLHEGFANYFEALFKQHEKGDDYFQHDLMQQASSVINTEDANGRSPLVGRDGYTANVYSKGCWVLHMLRGILGEQEFWKAIQAYARQYAFRNADSHEFMLALEDATGRNLGWFFEQWVYKAGHPKVLVHSTWDQNSGTLQLEFTQTQVMDSLTGVFKFPLSIECTTSAGASTTTTFINQQRQQVNIQLREQPLMVIVDKGKNVLATFDLQRTKEELVFQLKHASDIVDRIAAAKQLQQYDSDTIVVESLRKAALSDQFWAVRDQAVFSLSPSENPLVKKTLLEAYGDEHSSVRASAITALSHFPSPEVADMVWNAALADSSYLVLSSCMATLVDIDSARAFEMAARSVVKDSYRDIIRRAALRALRNLKNPRSIPLALTYSGISNPSDIRRQAVQILGEMGKDNPEVRARLIALVNDGSSTIRKAAVEGVAGWGDGQAKEILAQRQLVEKEETVKNAIELALESISVGSNSGSAQGK